MACEFCTDPDGLPCFPQYGIAPHLHGTGPEFPIGTFFKPREFWPSNFQEDPENPNHGTYWCPECGDGKPKNEPEKSTDMEIDLNELERLANAATPGPWFMYDSELWANNGTGAFEIRDSQNPGVAKTLCSRVPWPERAEEMIANGQFMGGANPAVVLELVRRLREAEKAAALERACQQACADLPEGWGIIISLEKGAGYPQLYKQNGDEVEWSCDHESIAANIFEMLGHAKKQPPRVGDCAEVKPS